MLLGRLLLHPAGPQGHLCAGGGLDLVLAEASEAHTDPHVLGCLLLPIAEHYRELLSIQDKVVKVFFCLLEDLLDELSASQAFEKLLHTEGLLA